MRKIISLVLMLSVLFTTTVSASTKSRVVENPTAYEYVAQEQQQEQQQQSSVQTNKETKHAIIDFVGTLLIGELGFHQFYNGHIGLGILYIFTGGLFGVGYIYSVIITLINLVEALP